MADVKNCDVCGKPGAKKVSVAVAFEGLAHPEKVTGTSHEVDACPAHQAHAAAVLHKHVLEKLREQGPFHAKLEAPGLDAAEREKILAQANAVSDARDAAMDKELKSAA